MHNIIGLWLCRVMKKFDLDLTVFIPKVDACSVADPEGGPWVPWNPPFKENVLCSILGLLANNLLVDLE